MKPLFLLLIVLVTLFGCTKEETPLPEPETCTLAFTEILPNNVPIHFFQTIDTVWFDYDQSIGMWIDGQIDWTCIGFTRRAESFELMIWTKTDTCYFTIPSHDQ